MVRDEGSSMMGVQSRSRKRQKLSSSSMGRTPEKVAPSKTRLEDIPNPDPFISVKLMSVRDPELSPVKFGKMNPLTLVHLLKEHVDPIMKLGEATYEPSCHCWLSLLWPLLCSLSSSWTPKPMENASDADAGENDEDDAGLVVAATTTGSEDSYTSLVSSHEDRDVLGKVGALDFGFKVIWKNVSVNFPVHVWKMLADTKDADLRANWLRKTLPQMVRYGQFCGIENVEKGRLGFIHLLALARGLFAAAELDCIGVLDVKGGEITDESFQQFEKDERDHMQLMMKKSSTYKKRKLTRERLNKQLRDAKAKFAAAGGGEFPSQKYLVADMYAMLEPENWDDYGSKVPSIYGTMMLLEYLLQALIGRRARAWTPEDVDKSISEKKSELSRSLWFANPQAIADAYMLCTNVLV